MEYAYYVVLFYSYMGTTLGISVSLLGAAMFAGLAGLCIIRYRSGLSAVYSPIIFPIACAVTFIAVQILLHDASIMDEYVRDLVPWIFALVIVQSLNLREGFFHRCTIIVFIIGLAALPFLSFRQEGLELERAGLDRASDVGGELANPNGLAAWFGFCAVYFLVFGLEAKRNVVRLCSWLVASGCLFIVGLTVSRGALFGIGLACVVAFRRMLKRGFAPLLILTSVVGVLFISGLYDQSIQYYLERGEEETGRLLAWPMVIQRFFDSPLIGVGADNVETYVSLSGKGITPHNSFLFIGLASGIVPLFFFGAYWWRAALGSLRLISRRTASAQFYPPLLVYSFVIIMLSNEPFVSPWVVVVLAAPLAAAVIKRQTQTTRIRKSEATRDVKLPHMVMYSTRKNNVKF
jgi:O-antigen ligase